MYASRNNAIRVAQRKSEFSKTAADIFLNASFVQQQYSIAQSGLAIGGNPNLSMQNRAIGYGGAALAGIGLAAAAVDIASNATGVKGLAEGGIKGLFKFGAKAGLEEGSILYRGVARNSVHDVQQALGGAIVPRGGTASAFEHVNEGMTNSLYTSWTTDKSVAQGFAGSNGVILQVNRSAISNIIIDTSTFSRLPAEKEILIKGPVYGVKR